MVLSVVLLGLINTSFAQTNTTESGKTKNSPQSKNPRMPAEVQNLLKNWFNKSLKDGPSIHMIKQYMPAACKPNKTYSLFTCQKNYPIRTIAYDQTPDFPAFVSVKFRKSACLTWEQSIIKTLSEKMGRPERGRGNLQDELEYRGDEKPLKVNKHSRYFMWDINGDLFTAFQLSTSDTECEVYLDSVMRHEG